MLQFLYSTNLKTYFIFLKLEEKNSTNYFFFTFAMLLAEALFKLINVS